MNVAELFLNQMFGESISTRSAIENLFSAEVRKADQVILDFEGIRLISSSAAHQFVVEIRHLEKNKKVVKLDNVNYNIQVMIDLASKDRKNLFTIHKIEHKKVHNTQELDEILLG